MPLHGNSESDYDAPLMNTCEKQMRLSHYCEIYGDHMPHRNHVYLPSHLTKDELYEIFSFETIGHKVLPSESLFKRVWKTQSP